MINVIGVGLDGIESLTSKSLNKIENSSILVGSDRILNYFPKYEGKKVILGNLTQGIEKVKTYYNQGERIVILATGDPLFFGIGRLLLQHFSSENLEFFPHLSSIQLAFNKIKIPWHDANILSIHGRSLDGLIPLLKKGVNKIFILTDSINNPQAIASLYLSLNLTINYSFYICENLGSNEENISIFSKEEINKLISLNTNFSALNVVILIKENEKETQLNLEDLPLIGIPDQYFLSFQDRPGLLTKKEVRLNILGLLYLQPSQIVWDIGAGTGSISIEIARLCPNSNIYAIEKTAIGISLIEKNSQRFHLSNVITVNGEAPFILEKLPLPDRIFIGGSGGNLLEILEFSTAKLTVNGIILLAFTTLEHFYQTITWLKEHKINYNVTHLQISRSVDINHLTRLSPLNPVSLIYVKKI